MDFLKSAVASISKGGTAFGYSFGDRVENDQSIWTLHNGTKRDDGSKCSIFSFDVNANRSRLPLAKNALRKFRTLRHPGIIKVLDTVETDQLIYIATERITPLPWATKRQALSEQSLIWGLYSVAKTLKFINDEAASIHGNIRASSIYTSESGEWKIGGLDILSSVKEDDAVIYTQGSLVPDIGRYSPPEVIKSGWESVRKSPTHAVDAYDYGILITEVFNGSFSGTEQIGSTRNVPLLMTNSYKRLTHAAPKIRLSVAHFLEQGCRNGGFFDTPLIQLTDGIDNLGLKSPSEREEFLGELDTIADGDDFPEEFFKVKVLPELLKSVEFGGGGPKSFSIVLKISNKLSEDEYETQITPVIIRLFTSPDRALRVCLLDNLPLMIDHLSQKVVTDKIFPQMVTGFGDLAPVVREQTVKAVLVVAPKLSDRVINGELLRHLAKTANDEQPGIRTNTTICLGKIARNLGQSTRAKVLSAAFSRALRDPFVHGRNAALMALAATVDIFSGEDCATKILPAVAPLLVDPEKMVRDQANKTLTVYLERVRKHSSTMPDTKLPPETGSNVNTRVTTPQPSLGSQGSQWVGWAVSSFTNKLSAATGEMQTDLSGAQQSAIDRPSSTPANGTARPRLEHSRPSAPSVPQLTTGVRSAVIAPEVDDAEEDYGDGWGDMDDEPNQREGDEELDEATAAWNLEGPTKSSTTSLPRTSGRPSTSSSAVPYDDGGEPDFEGWLNAQAQAKQKSHKALPKGLMKKGAGAETSANTKTTTRLAPAKPTPRVSKPVRPLPQDEDEDGWGDAWG